MGCQTKAWKVRRKIKNTHLLGSKSCCVVKRSISQFQAFLLNVKKTEFSHNLFLLWLLPFSRTSSSYHFQSTKLLPRSNIFSLSSYVGNKALICFHISLAFINKLYDSWRIVIDFPDAGATMRIIIQRDWKIYDFRSEILVSLNYLIRFMSNLKSCLSLDFSENIFIYSRYATTISLFIIALYFLKSWNFPSNPSFTFAFNLLFICKQCYKIIKKALNPAIFYIVIIDFF